MNTSMNYSAGLKWSMTLLLSASVLACGGGGGRDPILGSGQAKTIFTPPADAVLPGLTSCPNPGPRVTITDPTNANQSATTSTSGVANSGKRVTATFDGDMDSATITPESFRLAPVGGAALIPASVTYDASTKRATLTTSSALQANTSYTAVIQAPVANGTGTAIGCNYAWKFKTASVAAEAAPAIDLGLAESFGIASRAGLTSTGVTVVNGDIALHPTPTCVDSTGGPGLASQSCLVKTYASATGMTVAGSIYFAGDPHDNGVTASDVTDDLTAAWLEGRNALDTRGPIAADQMGGKIFIPGVYHNANLGLAAGQTATLDAQNDVNAVFIFKVDSTFVDSGTTLLPTEIALINGASAKNVWFVTGLDVTIGSGTTWNGNILAGRDATVNMGSTVIGRVLGGASGAGAIVLTGDASPSVTSISVP
jgi:hypothetical protein